MGYRNECSKIQSLQTFSCLLGVNISAATTYRAICPPGLPVFPQNRNILGAVSRQKLKSMHCILLLDLFNQLNFCKKSRKRERGGGDEAKSKINTVSRYQTNYLTSQTIILGKQGIHLDTLITTRTLCTKYSTESWMNEKKKQTSKVSLLIHRFRKHSSYVGQQSK